MRPRIPSSRRVRGALVACVAFVALAFTFRRALLTYAKDSFYQSHFLFLWILFAAALIRSTWAGPTTRLDVRDRRHRVGIAIGVLAFLTYCVSARTGSSTVERIALVLSFTAFATFALRQWSAWRCAGYAAFALLCFGVPYSVYHPLTKQFRDSFVALLRRWQVLSGQPFKVDGYNVVFPDFSIAITEDCSGLNQVVFFLALAFLGSLSGRARPGRTFFLFVSALLLAYASNLVRVLVFITLAHHSQLQFFDSGWRHELMGVVVYAPFIFAFVGLILWTHRPRPPPTLPAPVVAGPSLAWLIAPFLVVAIVSTLPATQEPRDAERWIAEIAQVPDWRLVRHSPTEAVEQDLYDTPCLLNAAFEAVDGSRETVQIFSYVTSSTNQLAVHQVKNCIERSTSVVRYGPRVPISGRSFWTIESVDPEISLHGYFAFTIDGEDLDDSMQTSSKVLWRRVLGRAPDVEFMRILFPGPLPAELPERERAILQWRAQLLQRRSTENR